MNAPSDWLGLARASLLSPRAAARVLLGLRLPLRRLWELMALVSVLTVLMLWVEAEVADPPTAALMTMILDRPILAAAVQFGLLLVTALALLGIGNMFGGKGDWPGALALVVWIQALMLALDVVQAVLYLVAPTLGEIAGLAGLALQAWLLTHFAAELHGFTNLWLVFFGLVISAILVGLGFATLMMLIGAPFLGVA